MNAHYIDWSKHDDRLGKVRDVELAREIGCNPSAVRTRRVKLGIPRYNESRQEA